MTNVERVRKTFENLSIGAKFKTKEIINMVIAEFREDHFSRGSIIPSDYCYNLYNMGQSKEVTDQVIIFEHIKHGHYKYLGEKYPYNGDVCHRPKHHKGYSYIIGYWKDGRRYLDEDSNNN